MLVNSRTVSKTVHRRILTIVVDRAFWRITLTIRSVKSYQHTHSSEIDVMGLSSRINWRRRTSWLRAMSRLVASITYFRVGLDRWPLLDHCLIAISAIVS